MVFILHFFTLIYEPSSPGRPERVPQGRHLTIHSHNALKFSGRDGSHARCQSEFSLIPLIIAEREGNSRHQRRNGFNEGRFERLARLR